MKALRPGPKILWPLECSTKHNFGPVCLSEGGVSGHSVVEVVASGSAARGGARGSQERAQERSECLSGVWVVAPAEAEHSKSANWFRGHRAAAAAAAAAALRRARREPSPATRVPPSIISQSLGGVRRVLLLVLANFRLYLIRKTNHHVAFAFY